MTAKEQKMIARIRKEAESAYKRAVKKAADQRKTALSVAANNAKFASLTKAQKRVAIAKDVLLQLRLEHINAVSGVYLDFPEAKQNDVGECLVDSDAPVSAVYNVRDCDVCAKGALFLSAARVKKGKTMRDLMITHDSGNVDANALNDNSIVRYLSDIFDDQQLWLIEAAFEQNDMRSMKDIEAGGDYLRYHLDDSEDERLRAIMLNIIENKGTFKPKTEDFQ
jgi:hypothetical protein